MHCLPLATKHDIPEKKSPKSFCQGKLYTVPPPPFLPRGNFSAQGAGAVYFEPPPPPPGQEFYTPPLFVHPPPLEGCFQRWGVGGVSEWAPHFWLPLPDLSHFEEILENLPIPSLFV